jgi:hypothetical protein
VARRALVVAGTSVSGGGADRQALGMWADARGPLDRGQLETEGSWTAEGRCAEARRTAEAAGQQKVTGQQRAAGQMRTDA